MSNRKKTQLKILLADIRKCSHCTEHLPLGPRPIVAAQRQARLLIIGQAPGKRVHDTGVPWDDPSGNRLRDWLGLTVEDFYDPSKVAIVPMGFCYPGTGKGGDLPPRPECAELWHEPLLQQLPNVKFTLLIGRYAQAYYLGEQLKSTLTATVKAWKEFTPTKLPLPHPSPRNNRWLKNNPWFETDVLRYVKRRVRSILK